MESTEIISPPSCCATWIATAVLPTAVGPAMTIGRGWLMPDLSGCFRNGSPAREHQEKNKAGGENAYANQVRRRDVAAEIIAAVVAAEDFDDGSQNSVAHQVNGED